MLSLHGVITGMRQKEPKKKLLKKLLINQPQMLYEIR